MRGAWRIIAGHEWRSLRADRTAFVVAAALGVATAYAILNGAATMRREQSTLADFLRSEAHDVDRHRAQNAATWSRIDRGELREIGEWDNDPAMTPLYSLWEFRLQRSAVYPDSPLAFLASGQRDMYPMGYVPDAPGQWFKETLPSAEQNENPLHRMIGRFDLAFVVMYLLPLFIVTLSYDLLASEKESGVLPLLLSQPVSLGTVVAAKLAVRSTVIVVVTLLLVVGAVLASGIDWRQDGVPAKFACWLVAIVAYCGVWMGGALVVHASGKSAAANAVALTVCWLVLVLLVPAGARFIAKAVHPIPPRSVLRDAKRDAIMRVGVDLWDEGVKELDDDNSRTSRIVARYLADHPDLRIADLPLPGQKFTFTFFEDVRNRSPKWRDRIHQQRFHLVYSARTAEIGRLIAPAQQRFERQYRRQHALLAALAYLSPQSVVETILTSLSGTSVAQHDRFLQQVEAVHEAWRHFFTKRSLVSDMLRPEDFDRFPAFVFRPEPLSTSIGRIALPLAALVAAAAGACAFGFKRMSKYPVVS